MGSTELSAMQIASRKMEWLAAKQKTVSQNIANADTPGYKAREVESFEAMLARTSRKNAPAEVRINRMETSWAGSIDGNTVVIEEQLMHAADAADDFKLAASLYRKSHQLLKMSVGVK